MTTPILVRDALSFRTHAVSGEYLRGSASLGYTSTAASELQQKLLGGDSETKIHSRVLGNVLYLMASQSSKREELAGIENLVLLALS